MDPEALVEAALEGAGSSRGKDAKVLETKAFVSRTTTKTAGDFKEEVIKIDVFQTTPAIVTATVGGTIEVPPRRGETKSFEFMKISVGVSLPCYKEEVDEAYGTAYRWARERFVNEVKEMKASLTKARAGGE